MVSKSNNQTPVRFGTWAGLGSLLATEALALSGVDFVGLDLQHGAFGFQEAAQAIQLLDVMDVDSLVRLAADELALAPRLLDYGATGIIVAGCDDAEIARQAVSLVQFQPGGTRSFGGKRFGIRPISPESANPSAFMMIETALGLENLAEIANVPGIAGLFIGPADLALALGLTLEESQSDPGWKSAVENVLKECQRAGIEAGMFAFEGASAAAHWVSQGFSRVVVRSDIGLIMRLAEDIELVRKESGNSNRASS